MTNILILGANGQLARNTTRVLLEKTDAARAAIVIRDHWKIENTSH